MSERDDLIRNIAEHPRDESARLVLADWMAENGQPAFGEYIRRKIAAAKIPRPAIPVGTVCFQDGRPTEEDLLLRSAGIGPVPGVHFGGWSRGLPDEAVIREGYRDDERSVRAIFSMPVRKLNIEGGALRFARLAADPDFRRVREISTRLADERGLGDLIASEFSRPLDAISFAGTSRDILDRLVGMPPARQPKELTCGVAYLGELTFLPGEVVWDAGGRLPPGRMTDLGLVHVHVRRLSDSRFARLADWPVLPRLRRLCFGLMEVSGAKARVLASAAGLSGLRLLSFRGRVTPSAVLTLAGSPHLRGVRILVRRDDLSREEATRIRDSGGPQFVRT